MLRVTPIQTGRATTLRLEGNLSGPWVDELRQCWVKLVEQEVVVEVDLRALSFLDPKGTALLLGMKRRGARLFGGSVFIDSLLRAEATVRTAGSRKSCKKEN
jgi:ABC-type transporter Mla MlaB component